MKRQIYSCLTVAAITLTTVLTSCKKENDKNPVAVKLLDTETSGLFHMRKFVYDDQNRIKEVWRYSGGVLMEKTILTYTGEDLIKREDVYLEEGEFVDPTNYIKNGNTINWTNSVEIIEGEEVGNQNLNNTITLNNDGFIEKWEGNLTSYSWVANYTIVNGNVTNSLLVSEVWGAVNTQESNNTYGDYRSAYSGCNTPKWFMQLWFGASQNVVTKSEHESTEWTPWGYDTEQWSVTYEYVYDSDGFPTKCTAKYEDGSQEVTEFKYKN